MRVDTDCDRNLDTNDNYPPASPLISHLKKDSALMSQPPLPWCHQLDQEAITRTILENTRTQFQFRIDRPA
ncbi:hypothetical protein ACSYAD_33990, partial [Acaryochloris marina NIES-2412]